MFTLSLDVGWYGFGYDRQAMYYLSLGVVRLGLSIPALDRVLHREAAARRALGKAR